MLPLSNLLGSIPLLLLSLDLRADGMIHGMGCRSPTSLSALFIIAWSTLMKDVECTISAKEVEQHIEMGKKMLAAGQLADALSHYHAAVEGDPSNYMTFYRRATVYLAMGKSKQALPDLDQVLQLKPDFTAARLQRGNVKLKQGKLDDALKDFNTVLEKESSHAEATQKVQEIGPLAQLKADAQAHIDAQNYPEAVNALSSLIDICPWDPKLREMRAECYIQQGDFFKAVGDIRPTTKLIPDNTAAYLTLSTLYYNMGEADTSLTEIRECLKLDPDHKACFAHYKKVKKLVKQMDSVQTFINEERWDECVSKAEAMMVTEPDHFTYMHRARENLCKCHAKAEHIEQAFNSCNAVLELDENNVQALCDRAETFIANEQFEEAIKDYQTADGVDNNNQRVQHGLKRAQKLLKQSQKRDYYKILGVRRNAKTTEINRAYRKLAIKWHPDKHPEGPEREKAQKVFMDIASAKEVLTDKEKRAQFDQGIDPLDPEEQAHQGGHNPFRGGGFNPFGQGGFNFKFHFN